MESIGLDYSSRGESVGKQGQEVVDDPDPGRALDDLKETFLDCHRCPLGDNRTNLVFGVGDPQADLVFVGEAPGRDEDLKGEPFVGKAGQMLTRIIRAMGLERTDVYICNVNKCRPPGNRDPLPLEVQACSPILLRQLEIISPKVICALGSFAARTLLVTDTRISQLRGRFHIFNGIPLMPTYHPSYLLRNPHGKKDVWKDMQMIMEIMGLPRKSGD
jgi:DNA polymerase